MEASELPNRLPNGHAPAFGRSEMCEIRIDRRVFLVWTAACTLALAALSLPATLVLEISDSRLVELVARRFLHDDEESLPTFFNFLLILSNVFLALTIFLAYLRQPSALKYYWLGLVLCFCVLAYDEAAQLHERAIDPMREVLTRHPLLHFSWTPLGAAVVVLFFALYLPFLKQLRRPVAAIMFAAGFVYISGALGIETIAGVFDFYYDRNWQFHLLALVEETFEMAGMILFGYALLLHIETDLAPIVVVPAAKAHEVEPRRS